jgi:hypothetical protein
VGVVGGGGGGGGVLKYRVVTAGVCVCACVRVCWRSEVKSGCSRCVCVFARARVGVLKYRVDAAGVCVCVRGRSAVQSAGSSWVCLYAFCSTECGQQVGVFVCVLQYRVEAAVGCVCMRSAVQSAGSSWVCLYAFCSTECRQQLGVFVCVLQYRLRAAVGCVLQDSQSCSTVGCLVGVQ